MPTRKDPGKVSSIQSQAAGILGRQSGMEGCSGERAFGLTFQFFITVLHISLSKCLQMWELFRVSLVGSVLPHPILFILWLFYSSGQKHTHGVCVCVWCPCSVSHPMGTFKVGFVLSYPILYNQKALKKNHPSSKHLSSYQTGGLIVFHEDKV